MNLQSLIKLDQQLLLWFNNHQTDFLNHFFTLYTGKVAWIFAAVVILFVIIKNYEKACNDLDMDAMLDCINPSIAEKIELATGVLGMLTGSDSEELFDKLSGLLSTEALGARISSDL